MDLCECAGPAVVIGAAISDYQQLSDFLDVTLEGKLAEAELAEVELAEVELAESASEDVARL